MAGNAWDWDWVSDWYDSFDYVESPDSEPTGPLVDTAKCVQERRMECPLVLDRDLGPLAPRSRIR